MWPKYLGGDPKGATTRIPESYHQDITNAIRKEFPFRKPGDPPRTYTPEKMAGIQSFLDNLYGTRFPLPKP